ncbi:MAG: hypothetical protein A2086_00430 [Spirochaetes bacterium GWD1_27_9]|nr:MAG: hypothetical protein A2Z98_13530 [Spirochaetes bacterium GWB1_27_13]OHD43921.1 MAG: hypothetical protein A2086_00430 [Spirochaetes bacterium GWD1_27_9]
MKINYLFLFLILLLGCQQTIIQEEIQYKEGKVGNPTFSPLGGIFDDVQTITISCSTPDAKIVYTIDGSTPSRTNGIPYTNTFVVNSFVIIKALAYKDDVADSNIVRSAYSFKVSTPQIIPNGGKFPFEKTVELTNTTKDSIIYYTTNGANPSSSSSRYTTPISISSSMTIKTIAYRYGWSYSDVATANFTFEAETPLFYPPSATYDTPQKIILSPTIYGAEVRYTTNGDEPSKTSTLYTSPILLQSSTTIKAITIKEGINNSQVAKISYIFKVKTPDISPAAGTYNSSQTITITSTSGASIYYTVDDTTPDNTKNLYTAPFTITQKTKIKAIAYKTGYEDSIIKVESYDMTTDQKIDDPLFSIQGGSFNTPQDITISSPTANSFIKYTLDGTTPSTNNYFDIISGSGTIKITNSKTIKAIAYKDGYSVSNVKTETYIITGKVETPIITLPSGTYNSSQTIEITSNTEGAIVRYTINGGEPNSDDTVYTGPISILGSASAITLKVKGFKDDYQASDTTSCNYVFKLPSPTFNPEEGTHSSKVTVLISEPVFDSTIRYTLDGTDPTVTYGTIYNGEYIPVTNGQAIKAIAYKTGWVESDVSTATYTLKVANPVPSVKGGNFTTAQKITLSCNTYGATIKYTTDGTDPKTSLTAIIYTKGFDITQTTTLKSYGYLTGFTDSEVITETYNF